MRHKNTRVWTEVSALTAVDRLKALLPEEAAALVERHADGLTEIRLRAERPVRLCLGQGQWVTTDKALEPSRLESILLALMEHSVYARQDELDDGFFTLSDGSRVGVCGRMYQEDGKLRMGEIGSACVRVARAVPGCADIVMEQVDGPDGLRSSLLISSPGLGKTTLLRDIARQLSLRGRNVCLADERRELAACYRGVPTLDVGPGTDVMDSCPRVQAVGRMLRSMAPEVIIADEIGGSGDALALAEASRCGVTVIASAHAPSLRDALSRPCLASILSGGVMRRVISLGPVPGVIQSVWRRNEGEGESAWIPM